ncbi:MAG: EFR1 family ferrodoxin [Clostridia bacterium]|nr:EFR1 family ferrodoxin [Clostridia bacterium]
MKSIIYYFSGTGNSLYTARKIAKEIGGAQLVSVRCDPDTISANDADVIGFVCPVYEWDIPGTFKKFIQKLSINKDAYIFMVATYIAVHGKCFETVASLLEEKGARLDYGRAIHCVASQCIAYPPFPPEKIMIPYMEKQMNNTAKEIAAKTKRKYPHMGWLSRKRYDNAMGPYLAVEHEYDKGFYTNDKCKKCGLCMKVCPNNNITMENGRPVWNHNCHGCNACVAYCPTKAIQFQTPQAYKDLGTFISKILCLPDKRKRYHHPEIKAKDLMSNKEKIE